MSLYVILLTFGVVLLAELPDKSMLATIVLSTKFGGRWVALGAAVAFAVHVLIAVTAGSLLGLLPYQVLDILVGVLFLGGALLLWRESRADDDGDDTSLPDAAPVHAPPWKAFSASFGVIFLSEWGDITQLTMVNLVAAHEAPIEVAIGSLLALWVAVLLAVTVGRTLLRKVSPIVMHRVGAAVFGVLAVASFVQAAR